MTKTFIYGVPNGFDFFEKDAEFNDYFKGFYISSRRGRRLMINRRDNGETVYSYLRYGLKEVERQPLHSFFGMSLVVDNYQFCPNFKLLLGWFDYLFNRLVNERNIIKTNEDGVLHYVIHKFEENTTDVEWLKNNLPNILKQTDQVEIINYDSSFEEGKAGQIISFNQPVSEGRLLDTFKKYRWISVAAEIVEKEEISDVANDTAVIELNYEDLNRKLNEYNQLLLPIAIDISKGSYDDLKKISEEVQEICSSLAKFIPTLGDSDEKDKFSILESKYDSLKNSISTLLSKMGHKRDDPPHPEDKTQYCYSCKENKPLSHFRSPEATKCKECEERDRINNEKFKICKKCGKEKHISFFHPRENDICDACAQKMKSEELLRKAKRVMGILVPAAIVVGLVLAGINLTKSCTSHNKKDGEEVKIDSTYIDTNIQKVDKIELDSLIAKRDFNAVYEYLKDKSDADSYISSLKDTINRHLGLLIDNSDLKDEKAADNGFEQFYRTNATFLDHIGFTEEDKSKWSEIIQDYRDLWEIIKKDKITEEEFNEGVNLWEKHNDVFTIELHDELFKKEVAKKGKNGKQTAQKNVVVPPTTYTLTYKPSKDQQVTKENVSESIKVEGLHGTYVTVSCKNGKIKENGKNSCTVILNEEREYKIKLTDSIVITITAVKK